MDRKKSRFGVSGTIYVNVDSPNLGFPYFNFLGVAQWRKNPVPGEENVDPGVGGDDDDEGQEEDLAVVQRVVDVRPVVGAAKHHHLPFIYNLFSYIK